MILPQYSVEISETFHSYEFISEGPKGKIPKLIEFKRTENEDIYNLAFGDKNERQGLDDLAVSDNRDTDKILATVMFAVYKFTEQNPTAWIYATGSSTSRNRLYQMKINRHLALAEQDFRLLGETEEGWERFQSDRAYLAFLAQRRFL